MQVTKIFLFLSCVLLSLFTMGQNDVEALKQKFKSAEEKDKPEILREIALEYYGKDNKLFLEYSIKSANKAESLNDKYNQAYALRLAGIAYDLSGDYSNAEKYVNQAYDINKSINAKDGIDACVSSLGVIYYNQAKYDKAIEMYMDALRIYENYYVVDNKALTLSHLGGLFVRMGDNKKAIEFYNQSYALRNEIQDLKTKSVVINNYVIAMQKQGMSYEEQLEVSRESMKIKEEVGDISGLAHGWWKLYSITKNHGDWELAEEYLQKAKRYALVVDANQLLGDIYLDQAKRAMNLSDTTSALAFYDSSYRMGQKLGDYELLSRISIDLGTLLFKMQEYRLSAIYMSNYAAMKDSIFKSDYSNAVAEMQEKYESEQKEKEIALLNKENQLSKLEIEKSKEQALRQAQELQLLALEQKNAMALQRQLELEKKQAQLENENKAKEIENLNKENELKQAKALAETAKRKQAELKSKQSEQEKELLDEQNRKKDIQLLFAVIGFILILALAGFILRGYRQKKKANALLEEQNIAINAQKEEIQSQNVLIEEKNKDIVDSITYAQRLQSAILPSSTLLSKGLRDYLLLFLPKDIVSGDFYWSHELGDTVYFAAVDCTGHGVPGAMVSMVGNNGLNRAVKEFKKEHPCEILDELNKSVIETFDKEGNLSVRDGMDIALCGLNRKQSTLEYAGANNPLWVFSKSMDKQINSELVAGVLCDDTDEIYLYEIKANKQPIGPYDEVKPFTNHTMEVDTSDLIVVFSDGYADQFGGKKGKKFKYSNLRKLIASNFSGNIKDIENILLTSFSDWKSDFEQLDDVCVIGVRV